MRQSPGRERLPIHGQRRLTFTVHPGHDVHTADPFMQTKPNNTTHASEGQALARRVIDSIEELVLQAETSREHLETEPRRSRLFELFVVADASGLLEAEAESLLDCDAIARELSSRWDLKRKLGAGSLQPGAVTPEQLPRLRLLWSFMRMWMEWSYAWRRWDEFHAAGPRKQTQ
jgi:hypothetical protein